MTKKDRLTVLIGGDLFPRYDINRFVNDDVRETFGEEICALFSSADVSICNLEGVLTDESKPSPKCGPSIKAPPDIASTYKALGVTCVAIGNNHIMDYGKKGFHDTCTALNDNGIEFVGAGENGQSIKKSIIFEKNGVSICIYNVAETVFNIPEESYPGVNLYDEYRVCSELDELQKHCDCLIVLYHGGAEYFRFPTPILRERFHRMADHGADIIIANHSHCIGTQENYKESVLLYGLGNLLFYTNLPEFTATSHLLEVSVNAGGEFSVKHILTRQDGIQVRVESVQEFKEFEERNHRLANGDDFKEEYRQYCQNRMMMFLLNFRGKNRLDRLMKRLLPEAEFRKYIRRQYSNKDILRVIECLRCDEFNEMMEQGMLSFLHQ